MHISDLLRLLESTMDEYGDLPVFIPDMYFARLEQPAPRVERVRLAGKSRPVLLLDAAKAADSPDYH
ncbi:Uncharacterised protein [Burkholderia pseudomallei]|nr:Uncharacterised protein [Burkholderia pseudomallei]